MTTYYVDTASSGGDGTTQNTSGADAAFATIAAMQGKVGGYSGDDQILFKRGCIWRETLSVPSSGTSGHPIIFGDYGSGAKPIISGGVFKNTAGDWTNDTGAVTVSGLKPAANGDDVKWGVGTWDNWDDGNNVFVGNEGVGFVDSSFVRFPGVNVPQGATITAASITFHTEDSRSGTTCATTLKALAEDNATAPSSRADALSRGTGTESVSWTIPAWTAGNDYTSPDITTVIQEVISRGGWSSGNALVIYWQDNSSSTGAFRSADSYNFSTSLCARLSISYETGASNLWYLSSITTDPGVLLHDGILGLRKSSKGGLAAQWNFWYDDPNDRFYVYSVGNPTTVATNVEIGGRDSCIDPQGTSYITFQNLALTTTRANAISVFWGGTGHSILSCDLSKMGKFGIQLNNGCTNTTITSCTFSDWGVFGGQQYAIQPIANGAAESGPVDITYCTFTMNALHGGVTETTAVMSDQGGWVKTFSNNTVVGNGYLMGSGFTSWRAASIATSVTVERNTISGTDSSGIMIQEPEYYAATPTISVKYNLIQNVCLGDVLDTEALRIRSFATSDCTVAYNVINGTYDGTNVHHGIQIKAVVGAKFWNNTIYGCDNGFEVNDVDATHSTGLDIRNNIASTNRGYGLNLAASNTITTWGYNCWYNNTSGALNGKTAGTGDVTSDPKFQVNGVDFRLQSSSPCIDAGVDVGLTQDYAGNPVPRV